MKNLLPIALLPTVGEITGAIPPPDRIRLAVDLTDKIANVSIGLVRNFLQIRLFYHK